MKNLGPKPLRRMAKERPANGRIRTNNCCASGGGHVRQAEAKELNWEEGQGTAEEQGQPYGAAWIGRGGGVNSERRFFRLRNNLRSTLYEDAMQRCCASTALSLVNTALSSAQPATS